MKSKTAILTIKLILIILNSCSIFENKPDDEIIEITFDRSSFPNATMLTAEVIDFNEPLNPMAFDIIYDTLILSRNRQGDPYYLELYNMKNNELVMRFAKRGRGPNEYLSAYYSNKTSIDSSFFLLDLTQNRASKFDIDSLLQFGENYQPYWFEIPYFAGIDVAMLDSSTALIFNKFYINNDEYSNNLNNPIFAFNIFEDTDFSEIGEDYEFFTFNVSDSYIAVSPNKETIWVLYQKDNRIDIFNKDLKRIKTLYGPEEFSPEYYLRDGLDGNHVSMKKRTRTFWRCFYTSDYIYVIYIGEYDREQMRPRDIYKFAWNGSLLHRYQLDRDLNTIYIDSNKEYIYGTAVKSGEYPELVRYKIK